MRAELESDKERKMIRNLSTYRRISAGSSALIRRFCTAVEAEKKVSAAAAQSGGVLSKIFCAAAVQKEGDRRLYKRLSALGSSKGLVAQTINEYIREGKFPRKSDLDNCIIELRRYGKYHQALEV